jgi:hypothetical protein
MVTANKLEDLSGYVQVLLKDTNLSELTDGEALNIIYDIQSNDELDEVEMLRCIRDVLYYVKS